MPPTKRILLAVLAVLVVGVALLLFGFLVGPPNCFNYDTHQPVHGTPVWDYYVAPGQLPPCKGHET